ncbi:MAG: hypothetical protein QXU88_02415 [Candidatus Woesearchaeota archaeon]
MVEGKKAALELSINVIVIVVIAITVLGLALVFIRGQFRGITGLQEEITAQVREQITQQLRASGERISFPTSMQLVRGEGKTIAIGIQNMLGRELNYKIATRFDTNLSDPGTEEFNVRVTGDCLRLPPAGTTIIPVFMTTPRRAGTFAFVIEVMSYTNASCQTLHDDPVYASKSSFITVA